MKNSKDDLVKALQDFADIATETLKGGGLSREQAMYFRAHPKKWHRRMFDLLMASLSETMKIYNRAIGIILRNATLLPPSMISEALRFPNFLGPDLRKMVDCWEVKRTLAYERFGTKFEFPPPRFPSEKGKRETGPGKETEAST